MSEFQYKELTSSYLPTFVHAIDSAVTNVNQLRRDVGNEEFHIVLEMCPAIRL